MSRRNCHSLRAAIVHLIIHRHRFQIWVTLMTIIARHSRELKFAKCLYEFCLFVKHHIHLTGESILNKHNFQEQKHLEIEFKRCSERGAHGPQMNCNHQSQWTIPFIWVPQNDPVMSSLQIASILPI